MLFPTHPKHQSQDEDLKPLSKYHGSFLHLLPKLRKCQKYENLAFLNKVYTLKMKSKEKTECMVFQGNFLAFRVSNQNLAFTVLM